MDHLSSCYFCATALDGPLSTVQISSTGTDDTTITLCASCEQKFQTVFETSGLLERTSFSIDVLTEKGHPKKQSSHIQSDETARTANPKPSADSDVETGAKTEDLPNEDPETTENERTEAAETIDESGMGTVDTALEESQQSEDGFSELDIQPSNTGESGNGTHPDSGGTQDGESDDLLSEAAHRDAGESTTGESADGVQGADESTEIDPSVKAADEIATGESDGDKELDSKLEEELSEHLQTDPATDPLTDELPESAESAGSDLGEAAMDGEARELDTHSEDTVVESENAQIESENDGDEPVDQGDLDGQSGNDEYDDRNDHAEHNDGEHSDGLEIDQSEGSSNETEKSGEVSAEVSWEAESETSNEGGQGVSGGEGEAQTDNDPIEEMGSALSDAEVEDETNDERTDSSADTGSEKDGNRKESASNTGDPIGKDTDDIDKSPTADPKATDTKADLSRTSITALEYNKVMRLLQNRQFPVARDEIEEIAANAYDLSRADCAAVIDLALERGLLGEKEGDLVRPTENS